VDAPEGLLRPVADRRVVACATADTVPVAGLAPSAEIVARISKIVQNYRRLHELGAPVVAGSDARIAPSSHTGAGLRTADAA
jgi:hypothetical protein